jgi:two-component system sensor histidine kinase VicK
MHAITVKIWQSWHMADSDIPSSETTEVWSGIDNVISRSLEVMSKIRATYDLCLDITGPSVILETEPIKNAYFELKNRGVKIRIITEITTTNISYCKEMMRIGDVRHLDGIKGNFVIADGARYAGIANTQKGKALPQLVIITDKEFVEQQQYFFQTLWDKAIPAQTRIREIEEGVRPEKTEVIYGVENVLNRGLQGIPLAKETIDLCGEEDGPSAIVANEPILKKYIEASKRGVRIRQITEITKNNILDCKKLMDCMELRHLDGLHGYFVVVDGKMFNSHAYGQDAKSFPHMVTSTVKVFVQQQQYFFNTLWSRAIPAKQRIKEIEEGRPPEKLEILEDTQKSISRAFDIMSKTQKELLVLFATRRTFAFVLRGQAADIYRKISKNGVDIKLLVPREGADEIEENNDKQIAKVREEISPSINLRFSEVDLNTRITIMISDRREFMSWELRDDTLDDPYLAGGIATYSNIKPLASSYAIIFDNLWKITELAENLRITNIKLESNEKAMKEFINIAAHELRTPIQPILGLSEMLYYTRNDPQQQRKLLDVIIRNAHKLENLAENILDVTRIESGGLKLAMNKVDLDELVESVVHDFQRLLPADGKVTMSYQKLSNDRNDDHGILHLAVLGDPERIAQVLSNLLRNALKFTKEGTINVRVGRNDSSPSSSEAVVYISDSGQGIDPEVMHKLFEKFTSKSEKGTGLGLFISKSIVEAHGGKIWGENNKDGKGATFAFTLPLAT